MAFLGAIWSLLGCGGAASAPAAMRWVEELAPDHRFLSGLATAGSGTWAAGFGLYQLDNHSWREVPGTNQRTWRGLSADADGVWLTGSAGVTARVVGGAVTEHRAPGAAYDILAVAGDGGAAWATAAGQELWRWDGAAWSSTVEAPFAGRILGALFLASDGTLFVKSHPRQGGQGSSVARRTGETWVDEAIGQKGHIAALHGTSSSDLWAVGYTTKLFGKGGQAHHWDGRAWTTVPLPVDRPLSCVYARAPDDVWVGGEGGTLLRWDGQTWSVLPTGLKWTITAILAPPDQPVRIIENAARILRWEDL